MKNERLDKTYSVRIDSGNDIKFPQFCTCCMAPTNEKQRIYSYYVEKSSVVSKETRTIEIEVPICEECRKHQRNYSTLRGLVRLFSILFGASVGVFMNMYDCYIPPIVWIASLTMFLLLSLIIRTKELPQKHTARYESVTITSPFIALGKPIVFVIFTFTNLEYAKLFQNANINIAGEIKENSKINTAKSTSIYSVSKPNMMECILIVLVASFLAYVICKIL